LAYVQSRFDLLATKSGRGTDDSPTGYGPVLDLAFRQYISRNGLTTTIDDTEIASADEYCFLALVDALVYDFVLPGIAVNQVDISVDAPLTSMKHSQSFRGIDALKNDAWARAAACGWGVMDNTGGFKVNLDIMEPGCGTEYR
jgi:hypothetical protein